MGCQISPIVINLYMVDFEIKAIKTAEYPPRIWKRYVDDTFVVIESSKKDKLLEHINKMDPHIHFKTEDAKADGFIPFLETLGMPQTDNSLIIFVYRKPTHTDLYLQWYSHSHLAAKFSVINTLKHRTKTACSSNQLFNEEEDHLTQALKRCKYPVWPLNRANINRPNQESSNIRNNTGFNNNKPYMVMPNIKGMSESCTNTYRKHGIEMHFKWGNTTKDILVHHKDRDTILQKSQLIYRYKCSRVDCEEEYIRDSGRTFTESIREHMRTPHPPMATITPLVMTSLLKISALLAGRTKVLPDPSKKQY